MIRRLTTVFSLAWLSLVVAGCGGKEKTTAEIDVAAAQSEYDAWTAKRIEQINADSGLTEAQKKQQIEEVKQTAQGQMGQVQSLADGQGDQRERGQ